MPARIGFDCTVDILFEILLADIPRFPELERGQLAVSSSPFDLFCAATKENGEFINPKYSAKC